MYSIPRFNLTVGADKVSLRPGSTSQHHHVLNRDIQDPLMFKPPPLHSPSHFESLPAEIVSEILTFACDNAGDGVHPKWRFPAVANRLSRWFYRITTHTHALWRYIYLGDGHSRYHLDHIRDRIARPHCLPFIAKVFCFARGSTEEDNGETDNEFEDNWSEVIETIIPTLPRLSTLVFRSVSSNAPILALLDHDMPMLETLDIEGLEGIDSELPEYNLSLNQFPALRTLRSKAAFHWENRENLPESVEKLYLDVDRQIGAGPSEGFWDFLPVNLRVLEIENLPWNGIAPPEDGKPQLPHLVELSFLDGSWPQDFTIIQHMDGSRIENLSICAFGPSNQTPDLPFVLAFPNLTHFTWTSRDELPNTAEFLRRCPALTSVHLDTLHPPDPISEFVDSLTNEPALLPHLECLKIVGTSIFSVRKAVQGHPRLKRVEVDVSRLGMRPLATKDEFREWEECVDWLDCHVELVRNYPEWSGLGLNDAREELPLYRSWKDMMAGRVMDLRDWQRIASTPWEAVHYWC